MPIDIPNLADAAFPAQSKLFSSEFDILGNAVGGQTGIISGCAVTAQASPNMTLAVASGSVKVAGADATVASGNVTVSTAHASLDRIDLVVVNSSGTKSVTAGTAAASPVQPEVPASSVVLAQVYVPAADTAIGSTQIKDRRIFVPGPQSGAIDVQTFTADGTWTKPSGALFCHIICIGQGGGGGSGRRGTNGVSPGGGGGSGAGYAERWMPAAVLGSTETVNVNGGGTGGAAVTANDTDGNDGTDGEDTTFGAHLNGKGGGAGGGGASPSSGAAGTASSVVALPFHAWRGGDGAAGSQGTGSSATDMPNMISSSAGVYLQQGPAGGGGGGGGSTGGTTGGAGGDCWVEAGGAGGSQAVGAGGGSTDTNAPNPGAGAGGGGSVVTSAAGRAGGTGGNYGGGGGGGSGSVNGQNSGAGGNGGGGICVVVTYTA